MKGLVLVVLFLGVVAVLGAALYYVQNYAFYEAADGRATIVVQGAEVAVEDYVGIDASSSGLKRRGCFRVDPGVFATAPVAEDPEPLTPPYWFDCFDPEALARDLDEGRARAYMAAEEELDGIDRIVAVYDDGRAYEWRQLNAKFRD